MASFRSAMTALQETKIQNPKIACRVTSRSVPLIVDKAKIFTANSLLLPVSLTPLTLSLTL